MSLIHIIIISPAVQIVPALSDGALFTFLNVFDRSMITFGSFLFSVLTRFVGCIQSHS